MCFNFVNIFRHEATEKAVKMGRGIYMGRINSAYPEGKLILTEASYFVSVTDIGKHTCG